MNKLNKKGFTIVELVIVIAVIAILAAVLIPTFSGVVEKANKSAALQACRNELVEVKAAYAMRGVDTPEMTFESKGFYFAYKDGALTETTTSPSGIATKLQNVNVYINGIAANNTKPTAWKDSVTDNIANAVFFQVSDETFAEKAALTIKIYRDETLIYEETQKDGVTNLQKTRGGFYLDIIYSDASGQKDYIKKNVAPTSTNVAGYYTYEVTVGSNTTLKGIFYHTGK